MDPIVFEESDGEVYDTGAVRLRVLAQSPDQPASGLWKVTLPRICPCTSACSNVTAIMESPLLLSH